MFCKIDVNWHWNVDKIFFFSFWFNFKKNVLELCKGKKLDLTSFKDNVPEHSVDLHAACPRCLAAEASKPGVNDGELTLWFTATFSRRSLVDELDGRKFLYHLCIFSFIQHLSFSRGSRTK